MTSRRGNHEGSIYRRASDQRWVGQLLLGYDGLGRPIRRFVTAKTRSEVAQKLKQLRRQFDDGLTVPDAGLKLEALFERWFEDVLRHQVAPSTFSNYRAVTVKHIVPALGKKKISALMVTDVDRLLSSKIDSGLSTSTVRRIRAVLSQCLDQGIRWGVVSRNVASHSRAPRETRKEGRTLSPEQAKQFLAYLKGHRNEALYAVMLSTGLRRGEALGLMWKDLDRDSGVLQIRRQLKREGGTLVTADTKTDRAEGAKAGLEVLDKGADLVVVSCDYDFGSPAALAAEAAGKVSFFLCAESIKAGIQGVGPHSFSASILAAVQGATMAEWTYNKKNARNYYRLLDTWTEYNKGICDGFDWMLPRLKDAKLVGSDTFKNDDASIAAQITRIKSDFDVRYRQARLELKA